MTYRPDIDGLRAVAVISVVLFHLGIINGGFVGVDVFFVISGYLITNIIKNEIDKEQSFNFAKFYIRRAKRLLPALFATLLASFVAACMLLPPADLIDLSGSLLSALVSLSNVYFWQESGYFDIEASMRPLLHTWSLSVEEQFYLVWPIALVVSLRRRMNSAAILSVFFVASLYVNHHYLEYESALFFLLPFRVFEFAIGAALVWVSWRLPSTIKAFLFLFGLSLIACAVILFSDDMVYPYFYGLAPCVGAAMVILAGNPAGVGQILSNRAMVSIGLISYSLYLVHWPLIVFWKYASLDQIRDRDAVIIFASSLMLGLALYRFVEQPFRNALVSGRKVIAYATGLAALIAVPVAHALSSNGWTWRVPDDVYKTIESLTEGRNEYWSTWRTGITSPSSFSEKALSVVVIGNSYAYDVANMLKEIDGIEVYFDGTTGHRCRGFTLPAKSNSQGIQERCAKNKGRFLRSYGKADLIILADNGSTWNVKEESYIKETLANIQLLKKSGYSGPTIIYGERPQYKADVYRIILQSGKIDHSGQYASRSLKIPVAEMIERINEAKTLYIENGVSYYSPVKHMCHDGWCDVLTTDKKQIYYDKGHFTLAGVRYLQSDFVQYIAKVRASLLLSQSHSSE